MILADRTGVLGALQEYGARRVGQDYSVEPVAVRRGVFHPKISLLFSGNEAHCLIGSGNLTFGGWGFNLELVEHLHSSFAGSAMWQVAEFFELLGVTDRVRTGAAPRCEEVGGRLKAASQNPGRSDIRFLHNLEHSISDQIIELADEFGGAERLTVAAPFWDSGSAIGRLGSKLGLDKVRVHSPPEGAVRGSLGRAWPAPEEIDLEIEAVCVDTLSDGRLLHAKAFEIQCARGAILVSGSPNATNAAIGTPANVEAAIARVAPHKGAFWSVSAAEAPSMANVDSEVETNKLQESGVLRADFEGEMIRGQILTPWHSPTATFDLETREGKREIGEADVGPDGDFTIPAGHFAASAWLPGRRILHARRSEDGVASGFVQIVAFSHIVDRAGVCARHMFAAMAGMESPDDIKAIIAWFSENPDRLAAASTQTRSLSPKAEQAPLSPQMVSVDGLGSVTDPDLGYGGTSEPEHGIAGPHEMRFLSQLLSALRKRTTTIEPTGAEGEDDERQEGVSDQEAHQRNSEREHRAIFDGFEYLMDTLLARKEAESTLIALDIGGYLCASLAPDPERAATWLRRIIGSGTLKEVNVDRRDEIVAAVLLHGGDPVFKPSAQSIRRLLHALGYRSVTLGEEPDAIARWRAVMPGAEDSSYVFGAAAATRTYAEQAEDCRDAIKDRRAIHDWNEIAMNDLSMRETIKEACATSNKRNQVIIIDTFRQTCPCGKNIQLPIAEVDRLRAEHVARSANCCGRVIVWAQCDE